MPGHAGHFSFLQAIKPGFMGLIDRMGLRIVLQNLSDQQRGF
jgi:hypothetical protein